MVGLGSRGVDLLEEIELHCVVGLLGLAVALEAEVAGLDVELDLLWVDIGNVDGDIDVVLLGFCLGRALCPRYCGKVLDLVDG